MEARDFAEALKEEIQESTHPADYRDTPLAAVETRWAFGDADFFVETDDGTFLVTVAKVAE